MASDVPPQPRCLTLTELVASHALFGGLGYLLAGWVGFWCGVGVVAVFILAGVGLPLPRLDRPPRGIAVAERLRPCLGVR